MITERLVEVQQRIAAAAAAAGRPADAVRLIAVSKLQPTTAVAEAALAGQRDFGENYAQELRDKARELRAGPRLAWHFIGPLQRNKVKYVVGVAEVLHTLDSLSLLDEVARRAAAMGIVQRCLIQVNVAAEPQKAGCPREELPALVDAFAGHPAALRLDGLMCIPPAGTPEETRPHFRALRELAVAERRRSGQQLAELSMGMSHDFAAAIEEGATLVRVGTAIFGERPPR